MMGTFQVSIEVGGPDGLQFHRMEAMVDTGATYLVVPKNALIALGCQPIGLRTFKLRIQLRAAQPPSGGQTRTR